MITSYCWQGFHIHKFYIINCPIRRQILWVKKVVKSSPKLQIDVDSYLIGEDSLLTKEDLKKTQLPPVGDCEIGSTGKACKYCTCGRTEEEEKVLKLGLKIVFT